MSNNARAEEALRFLVHFIGDMHMSLHLTSRPWGGNGAKVSFNRYITTAHSINRFTLALRLPPPLPMPLNTPIPLFSMECNLYRAIYDL
ncbi:hypothetical protein JAAARDRAFT_698573 [Jaapia argillacea MUCL 33604]|uniref:Uncharacterized protein n=1 Tax=Jaapia argillacea MUCL 33604 TaxID=933084 RepID=A0A067PIZ6_9AGAM|nr:hypothetical protein JAAARDRAFT_698573 [Jaapia argillacea MUCL 33604]